MVTDDLYFDTPTCAWGDIPNFLHVPGEPVAGYRRPHSHSTVTKGLTTISGWAVDASLLRPTREIMAVGGGRVLATAVPQTARPDVAQSLEQRSGARERVYPVSLPTYAGPVQLYSLNSDNSVTPCSSSPASARSVVTPVGNARSVDTADGMRSPRGGVNPRGYVEADPVQKAASLVVPPGVSLAAYHWLELSSGRRLSSGGVVFTDEVGAALARITFNILPSAGTHLAVRVGSCQQWHGYRSPPRILGSSGVDDMPEVWLAR